MPLGNLLEHAEDIGECRSYALNNLFPSASQLADIAVFCGTPETRSYTALRYLLELSRVDVPTVLLTGNPCFEQEVLSSAINAKEQRWLAPCVNGTRDYDPLYGLTQEEVVNAIEPDITNASLRSALNSYLRVMDYAFHVRPDRFGNYPYNLDELYGLTCQPFGVLEREVLTALPMAVRTPIAGQLSAPGIQPSVAAAVENFCLRFSAVWRPLQRGRNRVSLISAVDFGASISLAIRPHSRELQDYLALELQALASRGRPFHLVIVDLDIESALLRQVLMQVHAHLPYSVGLFCPELGTLVHHDGAGEEDSRFILDQMSRVAVLKCASVAQARPFSTYFGTYNKTIVTKNTGTAHQGFNVLGSLAGTRSKGFTQTVLQQDRMPAEALASPRLSNGALIFGSDFVEPFLTFNLTDPTA